MRIYLDNAANSKVAYYVKLSGYHALKRMYAHFLKRHSNRIPTYAVTK